AEARDVARHLALQFIDCVDRGLRPADVSDTPTRHREALAVTIERQRLLDERRMQRRKADELQPAIDELLVNLIRKNHEIRMLYDNLRQRFELRRLIRMPAAVAWRAQHQHTA